MCIQQCLPLSDDACSILKAFLYFRHLTKMYTSTVNKAWQYILKSEVVCSALKFCIYHKETCVGDLISV